MYAGGNGVGRWNAILQSATIAALIAALTLSVLGLGIAPTPSQSAFTPTGEAWISQSHTDRGDVLPGATFSGPGNWTEQTDYGAASGSSGSGGLDVLGDSCVSNLSYAYCVGGQNFQSGTDVSDVFYAPVSSSGVIGSWVETVDYAAASGSSGTGGIGVEFPSCVEYGGYIYCIAGSLSVSPFFVSKVFYAPLSASGVGAWTETTDFGAASGTTGSGGIDTAELACAVVAGYVYCAGGGTSKVFYAQLSASGVGPWTETTDYAAATGSSGSGGQAISIQACVSNATYLYCVGGQLSFSATSRVFYAPVSASGVGAWSETTDYGAASGATGAGGSAIYATTCFSYNGSIVCVDGNNATNTAVDSVYYAPLASTGVGAWAVGGPFGDAPLYTYHEYCFVGSQVSSVFALCDGGGVSDTFSSPLSSIHRAFTNLTTQLSATSVVVGTPWYDTATLHGATVLAGGQVQYTVYSDSQCNGNAGDNITAIDSVNVSGGIVPDLPSQVGRAGGFSVRASYSGDALNAPAVASCEVIQILRAAPSLTTALSATSIAVGGSFGDSATLSGGTPDAGGAVTYFLYDDGDCGSATGQSSLAPVTNGVVPSSSQFTAVGSTSGYLSVLAVYSGDDKNRGTSAACEQLSLTATAMVAISCTPDGTSPGTPTACAVSVTAIVGPIAGEAVSLRSSSATGTFSPAVCTLNRSGFCGSTYTDPTAGAVALTASYAGDGFNHGSLGSTIIGNFPNLPSGAASTSTTIVGGSASADDRNSSGISVSLSGSSAVGGTAVAIFATDLASAPAGEPAVSLSNVLGYYDVRIFGVTDGSVTVCIFNSLVESKTVLDLLPPETGTWVRATRGSPLSGEICGDIPVASLSGTPLAAGDPLSSVPAPSPAPSLAGTYVLAAVVGVVVVVAVAVAVWRRRGREDANRSQ